MVEVQSDCGNRSNMDNPDGLVCQCELDAMKAERDSGFHLARDAARGLGVECDGDLGHEAEQIRKERDLFKDVLRQVNECLSRDGATGIDPTSPMHHGVMAALGII